MNDNIHSVAIAIITCNRPDGLDKLLLALTRLEFPHFPEIELNVVVVENGEKLQAESQVEQYQKQGLNIIYAHEPTPGISFARNCAMSIAMEQAEYFAFIDDDEYPVPLWLDTLLSCMQQYQTPVVRGPVVSVLPDGAPQWAKTGGFYERDRFKTGTEMKYCASGNVLFLSQFLKEAGIRFDARFALTGGSDTLFFLQLQEKTGVKIIWCDEAVAWEDVPMQRLSSEWVVRRATREGSTMPKFDAVMGKGVSSRLRWLLHGLAHMVLSIRMRAVGLYTGEIERIRARCEFALGFGMIRGCFGQEINEYSERHRG